MTNQIEATFNKFKELLEAKAELSCVIAGGAIADHYFGKEVSDIDVFVSDDNLNEYTADMLVAEGFVSTTQDHKSADFQGRMFNRYGEVLSSAGPNYLITEVYQGVFNNVDVDVIFVTASDMSDYIYNQFDQSIKCAYYDGEYHYMNQFLKSVNDNKIFSNRAEPGEYVRAYLSSEKYGIPLEEDYNLSKELCALADREDKLDQLLSKTTLSKLNALPNRHTLFDHTHSDDKSIASIFYVHQTHNCDLWKELRSIVNKSVITESSLNDVVIDVDVDSTEHAYFKDHASVLHMVEGNDRYDQSSVQILKELHSLTKSQFRNGKFTDSSGRTVRVGKHIAKLARIAKKSSANSSLPNRLEIAANKMAQLFEVRGVQTNETVYFTGSKHALVNISTNTKWNSCQRTTTDLVETGQNFGILANLSGNTVVAYTTTDGQRHDDDSSKWSSRALVRLGQNGSIIFERFYSNIDQLKMGLGLPLRKALRKLGYSVPATRKSAVRFVSLPYISEPYGDTPNVVIQVMSNVIYQVGEQQRVIRDAFYNELNNMAANIDQDIPLEFVDMPITNAVPGQFLQHANITADTKLYKAMEEYFTRVDAAGFNPEHFTFNEGILVDKVLYTVTVSVGSMFVSRANGFYDRHGGVQMDDNPVPTTIREIYEQRKAHWNKPSKVYSNDPFSDINEGEIVELNWDDNDDDLPF